MIKNLHSMSTEHLVCIYKALYAHAGGGAENRALFYKKEADHDGQPE